MYKAEIHYKILFSRFANWAHRVKYDMGGLPGNQSLNLKTWYAFMKLYSRLIPASVKKAQNNRLRRIRLVDNKEIFMQETSAAVVLWNTSLVLMNTNWQCFVGPAYTRDINRIVPQLPWCSLSLLEVSAQLRQSNWDAPRIPFLHVCPQCVLAPMKLEQTGARVKRNSLLAPAAGINAAGYRQFIFLWQAMNNKKLYKIYIRLIKINKVTVTMPESNVTRFIPLLLQCKLEYQQHLANLILKATANAEVQSMLAYSVSKDMQSHIHGYCG